MRAGLEQPGVEHPALFDVPRMLPQPAALSVRNVRTTKKDATELRQVCRVWPPIDYELLDLKERGLLRGVVLNAGCGWREVRHLIDGVLVNQDLSWPGDTRTNVDIFSPLDEIPRADGTFDCVICIAVLEHVINPIEVVREMFRVTKPGGYIVASVPFLQPEHKAPTDYQRYTKDGLHVLFENAGFIVEEIRPMFSVYHFLHWLTYEWLHLRTTVLFKTLRVLLLPLLSVLARRSTLVSDTVASVFRLVARKPAASGTGPEGIQSRIRTA